MARAIALPLGQIVGITAYAMSTYSIGGWVERSAVLCLQQSLYILTRTVLLAYCAGKKQIQKQRG